jgi:hypothetical protein
MSSQQAGVVLSFLRRHAAFNFEEYLWNHEEILYRVQHLLAGLR